MTKTCARCGSPFVPGKFQRRMIYCGKECYAAIRKELNAQKCRERYYRDPKKYNAMNLSYYRKNRDRIRGEMRTRAHETRKVTPWTQIMAGAKHRAKVANRPFDLTSDWAAARWTGRCELCGIQFHLMLRNDDMRMFSASIDRIDPKKGYTQDNCRFILFAVNAMRQNGTDADVLRIAGGLVANMSITV